MPPSAGAGTMGYDQRWCGVSIVFSILEFVLRKSSITRHRSRRNRSVRTRRPKIIIITFGRCRFKGRRVMTFRRKGVRGPFAAGPLPFAHSPGHRHRRRRHLTGVLKNPRGGGTRRGRAGVRAREQVKTGVYDTFVFHGPDELRVFCPPPPPKFAPTCPHHPATNAAAVLEPGREGRVAALRPSRPWLRATERDVFYRQGADEKGWLPQ